MPARDHTFERSEGVALIRGGDVYTSFCSSDFLGFSRDKRVFQAMRDGLNIENEVFSGALESGGARPIHSKFEKRISAFRASEATFVFPSLLELLNNLFLSLEKQRFAVLVSKSLSSRLQELVSLLSIEKDFFESGEPGELEERLRQFPLDQDTGRRKVCVLVETISPLSGKVAPLRFLHKACEDAQAEMVVDDSFGIGVLGLLGSGGIEKAGLSDRGLLSFFDFSHALSSQGAAVTGSKKRLDTFFTPLERVNLLPLPSVYSAQATIGLTELEVRARSKLRAKALRVRDGLISMGFKIEGDPVSPIVFIPIEEPLILKKFADGLYERKVIVDVDSNGIRLWLRSVHTAPVVANLLQAVDDVGKKIGLKVAK